MEALWRRVVTKRRALFGLALAVYAFAFQGTRGLWEPDEGRYTAVAVEMQRLGDYVTPRLSREVPHLTKPPLTYWLLAGSFAVFGRNEWAARLPNVLAFLATILLTAALGRRLAPGSPLAPLVYATSLLPFVAANVITTDTVLTLWETLAVWGFVGLWWGAEERRGLFRLVTWLGFGLAFLTKGPPGLLPLLAIVAFVTAVEGWKGLSKLVSLPGLLVFGGVGFTWYLLLVLREPDTLDYFLRNEVFNRIFTASHDRHSAWYGGFVVYGPSLLVGTLPWTVGVIAACRDAWRSARRPGGGSGADEGRAGLFLLLWLLLPLAIFFLARSRMHLYLLPLFVPLSLLVARRLGPAIALTRLRRAGLAVWIVCLVALRGAAGFVPQSKDSRALARALAAGAGRTIDEVVFVDTHPRYGVALYLDAEVEAVTHATDPASNPWTGHPLAEELREEGGLRVFVVPAKRLAAFRQYLGEINVEAVPCGGWRDLTFLWLAKDSHPPRLLSNDVAQ